MNLLRSITVGLGWLSGTLAGIGAVLYACGYLITRAQLHLFGVSGFFPLSVDHFMQEGTKFVVGIGKHAAERFLGVVAVALVALCVVLVVSLPLLHWRHGLRTGVVEARARVRAVAARLHEPLPWSPAWSLYLGLVGLLVVLLDASRRDFEAPLNVFNILYLARPPAGDAAETQIARWLLTGDTPRLEGYFWDLFYTQARVILLLVAAWYATAKLAHRIALLLPFVVTLALYWLYLPMAYGILVRPLEYNVVGLHMRERSWEPPARLFLLSSTDSEFVVWDPSERKVRWVPKREVTRADVDGVQSLFGKPRPGS